MIEDKEKVRRNRWVIGSAVTLAILFMGATIFIPDSMQNVKQPEVDRYRICYLALAVSHSALLIFALVFWLFALWKQQELRGKKWLNVILATGFVVVAIAFVLGGAINFNRRYKAVTFEQMTERYEKQKSTRDSQEK